MTESLMIKRREMLRGTAAILVTPAASLLVSGCSKKGENQNEKIRLMNTESKTMKTHYLEIVTRDVEATVLLYAKIHGMTFDAPNPNLAGARTAALQGGGLIGVRAPLRDTEEPVVRPYFLVDDIEEAVAAASNAGAEIAMNPTEIPGSGKFAIFIQGGIETGLWQTFA